MKERMLSGANKIRASLYTFILSTILVPVAVDISKGGDDINWKILALWMLTSLLLVSVLENIIARLMVIPSWEKLPDQLKVVTASSQTKLLDCVSSHSDDIDASPSVDLLSDTLKSFVDNGENLSALKRLLGREGRLRILLMNPFTDCVDRSVKARTDNGRRESRRSFSQEILVSLRRLSQSLTEEQMIECVRFYDYPAFYASYIMGNCAFVTIFTYGRGGSSPSLYMTSHGPHQDFFNGVVRGFGELWDARSTQRLDVETLQHAVVHID